MEKKIFIIAALAFGLASCSVPSKTIVLGDSALEKIFKSSESLDASNAFALSFKNFTLEEGKIRVVPAYLQQSKIYDSEVEKTLKPMVSVSASQSFFNEGFKVAFAGDQITCSFPQECHFQGGEVTILVYANAKSVSIAGGSALSLDLSRSDSFSLDVSGASTVTTEKPFALSSFSFKSSGATTFEADGKATKASYGIEGTSSIKAKDLLSDSVEINISGLGNAVVQANKTLDVLISGTGNVTYYGNPVVTKTISGLGSVSQGE